MTKKNRGRQFGGPVQWFFCHRLRLRDAEPKLNLVEIVRRIQGICINLRRLHGSQFVKGAIFSYSEALQASLNHFDGDEAAARLWVEQYARKDSRGRLIEGAPSNSFRRMAGELARLEAHVSGPLSEEEIYSQLRAATPVVEKRPDELECDVVRFQNKKEKWVAFVGLLNGRPYEIFTGLQDDEEGIVLPKTVTKGHIVKTLCADGTKRYDFRFSNKRGYKMIVEGLSSRFNKEYWNYAKLISGVLRYGMPIEHVIKLVASLSLEDESINTWKKGVCRALKKYCLIDGEKYLPDESPEEELQE